MKTTTKHTLKEHAYLHFRKNGMGPSESMRSIRAALDASVINDTLFEDCVNVVCQLAGIQTAFWISAPSARVDPYASRSVDDAGEILCSA